MTKKEFLSQVELIPFHDCWEWDGGMHSRKDPLHAYGVASIAGEKKYAHRLSMEIETGEPIPSGMCVCHRCDNPSCVRPSHLFVATHHENMLDAKMKGRAGAARGEDAATAKLTEGDVLKIRSLQGSLSGPKTARLFGVTHQSIYAIWDRETWAHLEPGE